MKITLEISFSFKHELDDPQLTLALPEGADILAALHSLAERYPQIAPRLFAANDNVHRHINALINGGNASFKQGFHTILHDGDHLTILPPVGGG
jgi:molybdopterin converting factor small subunit